MLVFDGDDVLCVSSKRQRGVISVPQGDLELYEVTDLSIMPSVSRIEPRK